MDGNINPPNPKQRYGDLKVPLGLIPSAAKVYAGLALADGARKYGAYNWRDKAVEAMTYIHAADRHLCAWVDGEDIDPDSGKPHLGHALACLSILVDAIEVGNLIDNRPLPAPTGALLRGWRDEDQRCPLDGRNCDHEHPSFGEGDETTAYNVNPVPCACIGCCGVDLGNELPTGVFCRQDQPELFDEYLAAQVDEYLAAQEKPVPAGSTVAPKDWSDNYVPTKRPCDCREGCEMDRGWFKPAVGHYCCRAEAAGE